MSRERFPLLARREIQRRIASLPPRQYRWRVVPLPGGQGEGMILTIRGNGGETGFDVEVGIFPHGIEVSCGVWHSHAWELSQWEDEGDLCAGFGGFLQALLSPATRLVTESRRGRIVRWRLEGLGPAGWEGLEEVVAFHLPWGRKETAWRQNSLLVPPFPLGVREGTGEGTLQ